MIDWIVVRLIPMGDGEDHLSAHHSPDQVVYDGLDPDPVRLRDPVERGRRLGPCEGLHVGLHTAPGNTSLSEVSGQRMIRLDPGSVFPDEVADREAVLQAQREERIAAIVEQGPVRAGDRKPAAQEIGKRAVRLPVVAAGDLLSGLVVFADQVQPGLSAYAAQKPMLPQ